MASKKSGRLLVVLCFIAVYSVASSAGDIRCKYNEFVVEDIIGNLSCLPCKSCPVGEGLSPQCGSYIPYGNRIQCKPCINGETYSSTQGIESCQPCGICVSHQKVLQKCNKTHNSRCAGCETGFYLSSVVDDCQECSWCCPDSGPEEHESQCKKNKVPFYKRCRVDESIRCQPRCTNHQYVVVSKLLKKTCHDCRQCGNGQGLHPKCQSVLTSIEESKCIDCIPGKTFSDTNDSSSCKPCTTCEVGKKTERSCNKTHDTLCGDCEHGFYRENSGASKGIITCKQCSPCCGDEQDVIIPECKAQGLPKTMQCSFTARAIEKCAPIAKNKLIWKIVGPCVAVVGIIVLGVIFIAYKKYNDRKYYEKFIGVPISDELSQMEGPQVLQQQKERPSSVSTPLNIEFRHSGITVQCDRASDGERLLGDMSVEIHWENHEHLPNGKEIYLSPLIQFHGTNPDGPIRLDIPHSAYYQEAGNTWQIKVFKQISSIDDGPQIKLVELDDQEEVVINPCSINFTVTELGTYIVVGVPGDPKCAKKRMQCAVFGAEPKIGQPYSMNLYLLDDGESSLQKLRLEEEKEGRHLLQKLFHSLYPDVDNKSVIGFAIDNVIEGWNIESTSKLVFESSEWIGSYKTFPKIEATFQHTDQQIRDFRCTFKLKLDETIVQVPVFHYSVQEFVPNGIQTSDQQTPTDAAIHSIIQVEDQGSLSSLTHLSTLPKEVLEKICQTIDQTIDKRYVETVAVKVIPSITPNEVSLIKSSDQPFTSLVTMISSKQISLTTFQLYDALRTEGLNCDVIAPYLYEVTPPL